jgi:Mor family transcriptional regulator
MNDSEIIEQLPGDLRRIAEVIHQYFPATPYIEITLRLAKEFRCVKLHMHTTDHFWREIRDKKIRSDYDRGEKTRELALKYRLTERHIFNILGMEPESATAPSLLDLLK